MIAALEAAAHNDQNVVIAGDRSVPMERLLQVLAEIKRIGLRNTQVLMNPLDK